jgi:hypothetical protein
VNYYSYYTCYIILNVNWFMVVFDRLWSGRAVTEHKYVFLVFFFFFFLYPRSPKGEGVYCFTSVRLSVRLAVLPSVQDICRRIFLSNGCWWQKSDIWSQASYRYPISWEAFFDPSESYFLFTEERGYHKWALAHSSSYFVCVYMYLCMSPIISIIVLNCLPLVGP